MKARSAASTENEFKELANELTTIAYAVGLRNDKIAQELISVIHAPLDQTRDLTRHAREGQADKVDALLKSLLQNNPLHQLYQRILVVNHSMDQLREAPALLQRISSVWSQYLYQTVMAGYGNSHFNESDVSWWELCRQTKNNELAVMLMHNFLCQPYEPKQNIFSQLYTGFFAKQANNAQPENTDLEAPLAYKNYESLCKSYLATLLYDAKYAPLLGENYQEGWIFFTTLVEDLAEYEKNFNYLLQLSMEKGDYRAAVNELHALLHDYNHYLDLYRGLVLSYCRSQYQGNDLSQFKRMLSKHHVIQTMHHLNQLWDSHIQHILLTNMASMLAHGLDPEAGDVWQKFVAEIKAKQPEGCDDKWVGANDVTRMLEGASDPQLLSALIQGYILPTTNLRKHNIGMFAQPTAPDHEAQPERQRRYSM